MTIGIWDRVAIASRWSMFKRHYALDTLRRSGGGREAMEDCCTPIDDQNKELLR